MGTKAERQAARERVSAYHQAELAELLTNVVQMARLPKPKCGCSSHSTTMPAIPPLDLA